MEVIAIIYPANVYAPLDLQVHCVRNRVQTANMENNANKNANAKIMANAIHKTVNAIVHQV